MHKTDFSQNHQLLRRVDVRLRPVKQRGKKICWLGYQNVMFCYNSPKKRIRWMFFEFGCWNSVHCRDKKREPFKKRLPCCGSYSRRGFVCVCVNLELILSKRLIIENSHLIKYQELWDSIHLGFTVKTASDFLWMEWTKLSEQRQSETEGMVANFKQVSLISIQNKA